ncbi:FHA domain-containing protein [bacterium]|nr:FHA domain-containing protein [bacterium]
MKRIRCPKCDEAILFDETQYEPGRILVFECPGCSKKFRLRIPQPVSEQPAEEAGPVVYGHLVVLENAFHFKQEIPLYEGENVVGRLVKGTKANAAIKTVDPSVDTTHCMVTVKPLPGGKAKFTLRDAPSNTGTFLHNELLGVKERVIIYDGDIITIGATTMILREANDAGETE